MKSFEKYIDQNGIEKIHECSLRILSEVGVKFESEEALEIFRKNGVKVEGDFVFIDEKTLERALKKIPKTFELIADENKKITIGNNSMNTRIIGHPTYILKDNVVCPMSSQDALNQFKLSETSKITDCVGVNYAILNGLATDKEQHALGTLAFALKYSRKNKIFLDINVTGFSAEEAFNYTKKGIKIAHKFYGIDKGSIIVSVFNALSPLCYDETPLRKMMAYLDEDQACIITSCGMPMMTTPPSLSGMMALTNAEILAGIVFAQLYKPGAKIVYGNTSASTDMRTIQLAIGTPETVLVGYITAALADYYGIPFRTLGGLSDAKQFDLQAGAESMMLLDATYDIRPDIVIHNIGCMGSFNVVSLEKLVADEEIVRMVQRKNLGVKINDDLLCFDQIRDAQPRGTFFKGRTPKMYKEEFYLSKLFNKDDANNWQNNGAIDLYTKTKKIVEKRIKEYQAPERSKDQINLLNPYLPEEYRNLT